MLHYFCTILVQSRVPLIAQVAPGKAPEAAKGPFHGISGA